MITGGQLVGFTAASLVMIVIPGPGVLFVIGRALAHGRRTALATAVGHAAGNFVVAAFVAVGLGAILQRSATAFVVVKVIGAAYLVWLGIQAIRHRKSLAEAFAAVAEPREGWRAARDGVVVGLTNPKSYILFGAEVNVSFRFFDPAWLSAELERAGFAVESLTRRQPYPGAEVATPRAYILARAV